MPSVLRPTVLVALVVPVLASAPGLDADQEYPADGLPVSVERIGEQLKAAPARRLRVEGYLPVVTFRTTVEQRQYLLPFKEQLYREFQLTDLQRQSLVWSSRCCGINLIRVAKSLTKALERREARRNREEVKRELAQIETAAKE